MSESLMTRASLLVRLRDGRDAAAWGEFVDLYAPLMHSFCRKQGLQDADAADITQGVLAQMFVAAPKFEYDKAKGSFRGWLFTMTRNRLRDFFTARKRREQVAGAGDKGELEKVAEPESKLEEEWDREYRRQLYLAAARVVQRDVAEATWRAFTLTAVEGASPADAAKEVGMSVAAVYLAKSRVMARLKTEILLLEEESAGESDEAQRDRMPER